MRKNKKTGIYLAFGIALFWMMIIIFILAVKSRRPTTPHEKSLAKPIKVITYKCYSDSANDSLKYAKR